MTIVHMAPQNLNDHHNFNTSYLLIKYIRYTCCFHCVPLRCVLPFELVWPHWQFGKHRRSAKSLEEGLCLTQLLSWCSCYSCIAVIWFSVFSLTINSFPNRLCIETSVLQMSWDSAIVIVTMLLSFNLVP